MILAIDDSSLMRKTYRRALSEIDSVTACEGKEVNSVIENLNPISVVLMETSYRDTSAYDLLNLIRLNSPTSPIILITNDEESLRGENFSSWEISHFLVKPVDLTILMTTVRHLISMGK